MALIIAATEGMGPLYLWSPWHLKHVKEYTINDVEYVKLTWSDNRTHWFYKNNYELR